MSVAGLSDQEKAHKKSFHRRHDSGELDVFEAARYFSGVNEHSGHNGSSFTQKITREERQSWRGGRISLDMPAIRHSIPSQTHMTEKHMMKDKKYKQPSSPGGKLASFLNSLFHQSSSKKKKSKSGTQSVKDEDESPGGRRKRRSSISHFRSTSTGAAETSSGFRTPPPCAITPTKSALQVVTLPKYSGSSRACLQNGVPDEKRSSNCSMLDEKFKATNGISEKNKNLGTGFSEKTRKFDEIDEGGDSDSSSDLFELQNYDLGYYPSGLPVYETTSMDSIKRGPPISNGPM